LARNCGILFRRYLKKVPQIRASDSQLEGGPSADVAAPPLPRGGTSGDIAALPQERRTARRTRRYDRRLGDRDRLGAELRNPFQEIPEGAPPDLCKDGPPIGRCDRRRLGGRLPSAPPPTGTSGRPCWQERQPAEGYYALAARSPRPARPPGVTRDMQPACHGTAEILSGDTSRRFRSSAPRTAPSKCGPTGGVPRAAP
jgi:hypothetical protein